MSDGHSPFGSLLRDVGRRDLGTVLNVRREKEADMREVEFLRPEGVGVAVVRNIGGTQEFRVRVNGRQTFYPGEVVQVSSNTGHPGERINSAATPVAGTSTTYSVSPSSVDFPTPYTPPVAPAFLAFIYGSVTAFYCDADGNFIRDLFSSEEVTIPGGTYLGDGTIVCLASGTRVLVDPIAQTVTELGDLPEIGDAQAVSGDILGPDGRIYSVEFGPSTLELGVDDQTVTVTARSCEVDGSDAQTLGTFSFSGGSIPTAGPPLAQFGVWSGSASIRVTLNSIIATAQWLDKSEETGGVFEVRFAIPGGTHTEEGDSGVGATALNMGGLPYAGGSFGASATRAADALEEEGSDAWTDASGNVLSIVGTNAMSYNAGTGVGYWGAISSFGGATPHVVEFQEHPTIGDIPDAVFLLPED